MMGKPVIAGTRITVELILEKLAVGETIEELLLIWGASDMDEYRDLLIYLPLG
jgi:uncharacterized protein (DUF433 family)